jgi:hypothetical protein
MNQEDEKSLSLLKTLEGRELACVCFVRDYVELRFDGPILRSYAGPIVDTDNGECQFPEVGSRDALCEYIGRVLAGVELSSDWIVLYFEPGTIRVRVTKINTPPFEVAHFMLAAPDGTLNGQMLIW